MPKKIKKPIAFEKLEPGYTVEVLKAGEWQGMGGIVEMIYGEEKIIVLFNGGEDFAEFAFSELKPVYTS